MDFTAKARKIFAHDRYATEATGIVIDQAGEHESVCSLEVGERHCNARGAVMGGVLFTLADFAAAVAANMNDVSAATNENSSLVTHHASLHWVSLDSTIHYLAPATGVRLTATCKSMKHGHTTALYQTIIENPDNGKRIAIVETTMISV